MYFVLLAAAVAILTGVVAVAMGWGGELAITRRDLPVIPPRIRTASDVARLRLPLGLFGYQAESADEVLQVLAGRLAERDAEIARLRAEVQWLGAQLSGGASGTGPTVAAWPEAQVPGAEFPGAEALEFPGPDFPGAEALEFPGAGALETELLAAESAEPDSSSGTESGAGSPIGESARPESARPESARVGDGKVLSVRGPAGGQPSPPN